MQVLLRFVGLLPPRQRVQAVALFVLMIIGAGMEALGIGVVLPFLALIADPAGVHKHAILSKLYVFSGAQSNQDFVTWFGVGLIVVYAGKNLFLGVLAYIQYRFIYSRQAELTSKLFAAYLTKPYEFHLQRNSAALLRNVNQEVMLAFSNVILPAATVLIESLVTGGVFLLLLLLEPVPTLVSAIVLGATAGVFLRAVRTQIQRSGLRAQQCSRDMIQSVNQGLEGAKEIKVLGRESHFVNEFSRHSWDFSNAMRFYRVVVDTPRLFIEALAVVGILLIGLYAMHRGTQIADLIAMLGLFALASIRLMPALNRIVASMTAVRSNMVSFEAIYDDLRAAALREASELATPSVAPVPSGTSVFQRSLELRGIQFTYPGAHAPSLTRVDLTIRQGQSIALIGSSGAGKTTLVDLILGLLVPTQGEILVDEQPLSTVVQKWQRVIGYIPQPIFLADDTIRKNVAFGIPEDQIDDAKVARALEIAHLKQFVETLPERAKTSIGERGVRLSGGQRQRIGIARALYHEPEVLILDEATSALDNETESEIKGAIAELSKGRTLIIIAHRLTTVQECDLLFFLKDGQVVASAPYEQLLATSPDFQRMVKAGGLSVIAPVA